MLIESSTNVDLCLTSLISLLVVLVRKKHFWDIINCFYKQGFPFVSQLGRGGKSGHINRFLRTTVLTLFMFLVFLVARLERIERFIQQQ